MNERVAIPSDAAMSLGDLLGIIGVRLGFGRASYRVAPGLYSVGSPDAKSPVLISANYKYSFDLLRSSLSGTNAWILVLDTRGVNVWCAAGKGTFSTEEIKRMIDESALSQVVEHRELILPQLSAPGVAAHEVRKLTGFRVIYGPVRSSDIKRFIQDGKRAEESMRVVKFAILDRLILVPVEIVGRVFPSLYICAAIFLLSGLVRWQFDMERALLLGSPAIAAYIAGFIAGGVLTPVLLPWIPGRAFSFKGGVAGAIAGAVAAIALGCHAVLIKIGVMTLFSAAVSSYIAMHFTGASPYTSPSGVEKEMRCAIPVQILALIASSGLWIYSLLK